MKLGIVGAGNMGKAILAGYIANFPYEKEKIGVYDSYAEVMDNVVREFEVNICDSIGDLLERSDVVLIAVKPQDFSEVLRELGECKRIEDVLIISIAAGIKIGEIEVGIGWDTKIIRAMPNTAVIVKEAMTGICGNKHVTATDMEFALRMFGGIGKAKIIDEKLIDAVVGVSGSSPAYVFMFIEALADGACAEGMKRKDAYDFAAQAVLGAAKMVLETGKHPGELKDMVCSPSGTTIAAVESLEKDGMRASVIRAVRSAAKRSREMA